MNRVVAVAFLALACGCGPAAISLDPGWPARAPDYDEATASWTRHERLRQQFTMIVDAQATYKSPAWRAAFVARQAGTLDLSADQRAALEAEQKQQAAAGHEFVVALTAFDDTGEELHRPKSPWRVTLVDSQGRVLEPVSIKRDRRSREVIQAQYPYVGEFDSVYVVSFAPEAVLLGAGAERFVLRLASDRGAVDLTWQDQK